MADEWQAEFRDRGYVIFPGMAGFEKAQAARRLIDQDLATNYDPARKPEYDHISACPDIRSAKEITALLRTTPISGVLDDIFGIGNIDHDHGQIAIRWAHNADYPCPPEAHIDGIPNEQNRLSGSRISNFTALVGIFLSDVTEEFAGNFTDWPGSHLIWERYFRKRGPDAMAEGLPEISLGEPIQLLCSAGDILLCHYQLAHTAAVNTSSNDRFAVYFRIWFNDIDERRWELLDVVSRVAAVARVKAGMIGGLACLLKIEPHPMPYKFHDARRHHIPKATYRVRNWPAHNAGLCQRGSITIWLSPDKIDSWRAPKRTGRGGELVYSDNAIEAMLTLGAVYHLRLRQTHGFTKSLFELLDLDLPVASVATLCRRRKALSIAPWIRESSEPLDLVLDSTGLKIFGQGEWCSRKHGKKPRGWKKVHVGLDAKSGMIVANLLTDKDTGDSDQVGAILDQVDGVIGRFMADGAYDGDPVYDVVRRHSPDPVPEVIIPPRITAVLSCDLEDEQTERDRHILEIEAKGRMAWQKAHDYGRRSLVETAIGRYKSIIGDRLRGRHDDAQPVELALGIQVLNHMMNLAKPASVRIG